MNRVALHLSEPITRDALREVFQTIRDEGGRVVVVEADRQDEARVLDDLIGRLDDEFDRLFAVVGDDLFEYIAHCDCRDCVGGASVLH